MINLSVIICYETIQEVSHQITTYAASFGGVIYMLLFWAPNRIQKIMEYGPLSPLLCCYDGIFLK